ncbi:MAG: DUF21 domain-containing protein [SAR324 cluster bacterium]|nr:DUF21 domain-containing protein [SAR324 cluster bacterium]
MNTVFIWIGILLCLLQSGMFSGLILALLGMGRLRLEAEAGAGDLAAQKVLMLRKDANFLLTTLIWGNVIVNTLLTLLSDSVLAGVGAFVFSVLGITFFGEILPQAYFSRNALRIGAMLAPVVKIYQFILYPLAKPTAVLLDHLVGPEGINYMKENSFKVMLEHHAGVEESDISRFESMGAINFLHLDDITVLQEGECIDPQTIIQLPFIDNHPVFPAFEKTPTDSFLHKILVVKKKWVIIEDSLAQPHFALNVDDFIRDLFVGVQNFTPKTYCHRPVIITNPKMKLGEVIQKLRIYPEHAEDDVIDYDLILVWCEEKRIITGSDLLGRILRGAVPFQQNISNKVEVSVSENKQPRI